MGTPRLQLLRTPRAGARAAKYVVSSLLTGLRETWETTFCEDCTHISLVRFWKNPLTCAPVNEILLNP